MVIIVPMSSLGYTIWDQGAYSQWPMGGVTRNYQVKQVVIFEKNNDKLQLGGDGSYMGAVAKAKHAGVIYDLSLMTCYGTSYGNGDASHRLVLFASAI